MQTSLCSRAPALLACVVTLSLIGCGGSGSEGGGSGGGGASYTLGGTLGGLGTGQSVSLQDNGADTLTLSASGAFSFPMSLDTGSAYDVTVQSHTLGITCWVTNGSGTVGSSDVTGIDVSCASTLPVLYSFGASATDGKEPLAGLIMDGAGNFYGTTSGGGAYAGGVVFKIAASGTETILHSFGASATDGQLPGPLIMDSAGNVYGTTASGGANSQGTVFKIDAAGTETILHSFAASGTDGQSPEGGLIMDGAGNLYGTTVFGGPYLFGTAFKIDPAGTETILHSFGASGTDGLNPAVGLIMDSAGNLYGMTHGGGAYLGGVVFKIAPSGTETILYSFGASATDGQGPEAGPIMDSAGNLYGTTAIGGAYGKGTVFVID
ncbi:MAG: choice-of-anchor tandem repeat GloVer-containing protein [Acidobacteriaceae bacterium]